jgi:hypothetical protein
MTFLIFTCHLGVLLRKKTLAAANVLKNEKVDVDRDQRSKIPGPRRWPAPMSFSPISWTLVRANVREFEKKDVAHDQCPGNRKNRHWPQPTYENCERKTLVVTNVQESIKTDTGHSPTSTNIGKTDIGRDQRLENHRKKTLDGSNIRKLPGKGIDRDQRPKPLETSHPPRKLI